MCTVFFHSQRCKVAMKSHLIFVLIFYFLPCHGEASLGHGDGSDQFDEELVMKALSSGHVNTYFQFTIRYLLQNNRSRKNSIFFRCSIVHFSFVFGPVEWHLAACQDCFNAGQMSSIDFVKQANLFLGRQKHAPFICAQLRSCLRLTRMPSASELSWLLSMRKHFKNKICRLMAINLIQLFLRWNQHKPGSIWMKD